MFKKKRMLGKHMYKVQKDISKVFYDQVFVIAWCIVVFHLNIDYHSNPFIINHQNLLSPDVDLFRY